MPLRSVLKMASSVDSTIASSSAAVSKDGSDVRAILTLESTTAAKAAERDGSTAETPAWGARPGNMKSLVADPASAEQAEIANPLTWSVDGRDYAATTARPLLTRIPRDDFVT